WDADLGEDRAVPRLRERLRARGLLLMLDFVPNHTGLDHPWVEDHPEYYIAGTEEDLARAPQNYTRVKRTRGDLLLAHGHARPPGRLRADLGSAGPAVLAEGDAAGARAGAELLFHGRGLLGPRMDD